METAILQLIINGLLLGGIYALISIGLTLIFGVLEIVNFAHGEFLMLAMYASYFLFQLYGVDPYLSLVIILPLFFLIGVAVQRVTIQPILNAPPLNQIFMTVGLSMVMQNLALFFWKADYRTVKTGYSSLTLKVAGLMISFPRLVAFILAMALIAGLLIFLQKTSTAPIRSLSGWGLPAWERPGPC
jgi:branched-chain amino acid transport system permease protein